MDSLGSLQFRHWLGPPPDAIRQTIQTLEHPGVDYEAYRMVGKRSGIYNRRSKADFSTLDAARVAFQSYVAMIESGPHQLVWGGFNFDTENVRAIIEDVAQVDLQNSLLIVGAQQEGNTWDLECRWRFRLTPI